MEQLQTMTNELVFTTTDGVSVLDINGNTMIRFKESSGWSKSYFNTARQVPLLYALKNYHDIFIFHEIGTSQGPEWWSGFVQNKYADKNQKNIIESLPQELMDKIRNKTAMVHIDQSLEAFPLADTAHNYYDNFYKALKQYNLPPEQFVYTTCNFLEEDEHSKWCEVNGIQDSRINVVACNFFAAATSITDFFGSGKENASSISVSDHIEFKSKNPIKLFNCLNRVLRVHRIAFTSMLNYYGLLADNLVSQDRFYDHFKIKIKINEFKNHPAFDESNVIDINNKLPLILDTDQFQINQAQHFFKDLYLQTYVTVVTETYCVDYHNTAMFFSEKIYKPIRARVPFIIVGAPNSLKFFQQQGFRTFAQWWDESYDSITDNTERLDAICKLLIHLKNKTADEWIVIYNEMQETLNHNYNVLMDTHWLGKFKNLLEERINNEL